MRVIVPTDFSENARNAFAFAFEHYGKDAEYILLNTYETPNAGSGGMLVSIDDILEKESLKELRKEEQIIRDIYPGLNLVTDSVHGSVEDGIHRVHSKKPVDIVYIGTTGASGLKEVLLGSNAERVIRESLLPVMAIPSNCSYAPIKRVVLATDLKANHSEDVFNPLLKLLKDDRALLNIIHVHSGEDPVGRDLLAEREKLEQIFSSHLDSFEFINTSDIPQGINDFIENKTVDVLAMVPRKVNFFQRLFKQSISKDMAYHTKVPLLTLKD